MPHLDIGQYAPWFLAPVADGNPRYAFDTAAGRPMLMLLFGKAAHPACAEALGLVAAHRHLFDDDKASFFGVTVDRDDVSAGRIRQQLPGIRFFLDYDRTISRTYGAQNGTDPDLYDPHWLVLDATLRVVGGFGLRDGAAAFACLEALIAAPPTADWAPVALAPNVLEPEICRDLIALYEADGGEESGFMRDVDGRTREVFSPEHKVRRDFLVPDGELARTINRRLAKRLVPVIQRTFQFHASRVERVLVGCYEADSGGHFRAHRDNTTRGTAHRRFAVTINLNAEDYEGGDLWFPEFGRRTYRAPTGGAIAFSCSLLHQAMPVTRGRRFALLPFLYGEEDAAIREANAKFLEGELANYKANNDVAIR